MKRRYVGLFFWPKPARLILNTYNGDSLAPKCTESIELFPVPPLEVIEATRTLYIIGRPLGEARQEFKFRAESDADFLDWKETIERYKQKLAQRLVK